MYDYVGQPGLLGSVIDREQSLFAKVRKYTVWGKVLTSHHHHLKTVEPVSSSLAISLSATSR